MMNVKKTIRCDDCDVLVHAGNQVQCGCCKRYRKTLNSMASRAARFEKTKKRSSCTNFRYLTSPEKLARLRQLQQKDRRNQQKIRRLEAKPKACRKTAEVTDKESQENQRQHKKTTNLSEFIKNTKPLKEINASSADIRNRKRLSAKNGLKHQKKYRQLDFA